MEFGDESEECDGLYGDGVENTAIGKAIIHSFKGWISKLRSYVDGKFMPEDVCAIYAIIK